MNKTININLAGMLFHIDEDAFQKLQEYLNVLKRAYANEPGSDEIISDIEARIAELFNEAKLHENQVIDLKNVEETINIMGQPEDLFDDDQEASSASEEQSKQEENTSYTNEQKKELYRDTSNAYISGVSSGLGHYFQVSVIWIRLSWLLLVFFSGGTFILLYMALWFFVPEAKTTAEKLAMKGKSVNVSNIEAKIKEGFNSVADTMKSAYHKNNGEEIKNKSAVLVSRLERFLGKFFKILSRLLGLCLMFVSGIGIVSLIATFLGFNIANSVDLHWIDYHTFSEFGSPLWLASILICLTAGIPLFFIFVLGLKIAFPHVKKVGRTVMLSLIGTWLLALTFFVIFQFINDKRNAVTANSIYKENINLTSSDTLKLVMRKKDRYINKFNSTKDLLIKETIDGQKVLVFRDIMIYVQTTNSESPYLEVKKSANGLNYNEALERAKKIDFNFEIENNTLFLDGYALGDYNTEHRGQKVKIFLNLPENITLFADPSTRDYNNRRKASQYAIIRNKENKYLELNNGKAICKDCDSDGDRKDFDINIDFNEDDFESELEEKIERLIEDNIHIDDEDHELDFNGKSFNIKINENGIQINSSEKSN